MGHSHTRARQWAIGMAALLFGFFAVSVLLGKLAALSIGTVAEFLLLLGSAIGFVTAMLAAEAAQTNKTDSGGR